ncbi:hypothetical protein BGLA2_360008 [Burkholderia gladioli]|nr:hypothetical protein BGLA2_360008 [Burkholderia gladioli]
MVNRHVACRLSKRFPLGTAGDRLRSAQGMGKNRASPGDGSLARKTEKDRRPGRGGTAGEESRDGRRRPALEKPLACRRRQHI